MQNEKINPAETSSCAIVMGPQAEETIKLSGRYHVECFDAEGNLKWEAPTPNIVATLGKNALLDAFFGGSGYTASLALGLKGTGTAVVGDTMASHGGWLEVGATNAPTYTGPRKVPAWSAAASGQKVMSAAASFAILTAGTVAGCFMVSGGSTTIDNTTGTLYSAGDFTGGARTVAPGDTLNVTYTATA